MEELATVVAAVGHAGAVEGGVRPVQLLLSVTFHEEVDRHHSCTLRETRPDNICTQNWSCMIQKHADDQRGNLIDKILIAITYWKKKKTFTSNY